MLKAEKQSDNLYNVYTTQSLPPCLPCLSVCLSVSVRRTVPGTTERMGSCPTKNNKNNPQKNPKNKRKPAPTPRAGLTRQGTTTLKE